MDERVENLVLGGGESGKHIAWMLGHQGRQVVVVERKLIGGACPNIACLPSKNVIRSAQVAHHARHGAEYGVRTANLAIEMTGVRARKRTMVEEEIAFHRNKFAEEHDTFILGEGRLVGPRTVEVQTQGGTRRFVADRLFLDLGTRAAVPDIPGLADAAPLTHVEALELDRVPPHLIVLGVGYVGVELAQAFRRFGSTVTMLGRGDQLLAREDPDVSDALRSVFTGEGIDVQLGVNATAIDGTSGQGVRVRIDGRGGARTIEASDILVAVGRTPNTRSIGLEEAGIALDAAGYIVVDDHLRTRASGVWAMGECAGSPKFTHIAFDDFRIVRDDLVGGSRSKRGRLVPYCVFTDPELAHIGLDETTARREGIRVRVGRWPMSSVLRAHAIGEMLGFMKVLVAADDDRILGFTMLGADAGEVCCVVATAMLANMPFTALRDAILPHPTMAEGLGPLLSTVPGAKS
jgi:pyruvate/2-oxoglutarate dehydrogenase complex dihydrolipoamide dehydrogenase (E3) component